VCLEAGITCLGKWRHGGRGDPPRALEQPKRKFGLQISRRIEDKKILIYEYPNETEKLKAEKEPPFVNIDNKRASCVFDAHGSLTIAPYCTISHTQRACNKLRATRATGLLSDSTQPLTVFGVVHIQMTHSENAHMYGRAYLGSTQF